MRICITCVGIVLLFSCGKESQSTSNLNDVEDIVSMQARGDGSFDVVCKDGSREIATSNDIRSGNVCSDGSGGGSNILTCVARDNDDRAPWVFARFTDQGELIKISKFRFDAKSTCQSSVNDGKKFIGNKFVLCVARDNDDRAPWIRTSIDLADGTIKNFSGTFDTFDSCRSSITEGRAFGSGLISCVARDNDNRDPWVLSNLTGEGEMRVKGSPVYANLGICHSVLNNARETRTSLLMCLARDNDDRAPWIIGGVNKDSQFFRNSGTQFGSISECNSALNGG